MKSPFQSPPIIQIKVPSRRHDHQVPFRRSVNVAGSPHSKVLQVPKSPSSDEVPFQVPKSPHSKVLSVSKVTNCKSPSPIPPECKCRPKSIPKSSKSPSHQVPMKSPILKSPVLKSPSPQANTPSPHYSSPQVPKRTPHSKVLVPNCKSPNPKFPFRRSIQSPPRPQVTKSQ